MNIEAAAAQTIKGYELRERIGAGGFGAVYRAYQSTVGREVAIKIILPGLANQPDFIRRFEAEAQIVARLEHPHITPLYDYWRDQDGAYLVMRWLRGGSLREALQNTLDLRTAALILEQVAGALSLAHRSNVIHRDIKPGNILLDEDANAYLTDFGIAKDLNLASSNTQPDAIMGSLDYISPEQARGEPVTARTDIYSLGVTLYEIIVGQHPFHNLSSVERLYKHISDPLPEITTLDPAVSASINRVIQKATAKNPDHRYPDALAFAADFREAAGLNRTSSSVIELLTQREHDILTLVIEGLSNKEIAQRLTVTLSTVKWYINQIYAKLGVRSRVQAIVRARELNLIGTGTVSRAVEANGASVSNLPEPENPYKGLRAFQAADEQDFFGREDLTQKLVKRLGEAGEAGRFLVVVGPSGSGKSSVVKAGLIPAIWRGDLPGSEKWFVVEMLPGTHPLDKLEVALMRVAANQSNNLHEQLARDERGLLRAADLILPNDGSELLLVIDQFEEAFTLVEDEAERQHFLNLLATAARDSRSRVRVVMTLRADFYDRPLNFPDFGELVRSHMETVLPLTAKGLERAISAPAERNSVTFEAGLVASIVAEMNYQVGALPLLQYALTELFERREGRRLTQKAYQEIGGAVGALAKRAEDLYRDLSPEGQEAARQMFLRLVTLGEGVEDTRRRALRSELLNLTPRPPLHTIERGSLVPHGEDTDDLMDDIIDIYAAYRLLTLDNDLATRTPTIELAHEALLREWERLRGWLNESRADIRLQRQLAAMADDWRAAKQDASYLARGSRLEQFEKWAKDTQLALTPGERDYLNASLAERERQNIAEKARQEREEKLEIRSRNFLRGLVAVMLLATLGAFGLTGVAVNQSDIAQNNAVDAQNARATSEANVILAEHNASAAQNVALVAGSQAALANGNTDLAIALALNAITLYPASAPAQVALGQAAYAPGTVRRFVGHTDQVWGVAFSPDGQTVVSGGDEKTLIQWNLATGQIIRRFTGGHTAGHIKVAFSPDGHTILSGADDGLVLLWDVATGNVIRRFGENGRAHSGWVGDVKFSPDGRTALSCGQDGSVILWDVTTGRMIYRFSGHSSSVQSVVFSPDGKTALSGGDDGMLILWDLTTGRMLHSFNAQYGINEVAMSPDGNFALTTTFYNTFVNLWDLRSGQVVRVLKGHTGITDAVAFSPDGQTAISGSADGTIIQWDLQSGQMLKRLWGHTAIVHRVTLSTDGRYVLSSSADNTVRLWDLEPGQIIHHFPGQGGLVQGAAFSPDGRTALTVSGNAKLWDVQTGKELQSLDVGPNLVAWGAAYTSDGQRALIGTADYSAQTSIPGDIILWDLQTGKEIRRFVGQTGQISHIAISPDGQTFLSGGHDGSLLLWDIQTGKMIRQFEGQDRSQEGLHHIWSIAFSPDGSTALTGDFVGDVLLWDVQTGQILRRLEGHHDIVNTIAFSHDGKTALTAGLGGAFLWDMTNGTVLHSFPGAMSAVFSPDERTIFMGSQDATNLIWDISTGTVVRQFLGAGEGLFFPRYSPDGHTVLATFSDGRVELWRVDSQDELLAWTKANRYIPDLTCDQRALYRLEPLCDENGALPQPAG